MAVDPALARSLLFTDLEEHELEAVRLTRAFLEAPERYLRAIRSDPADEE